MKSAQPADRALELWAGLECTVNRVGDRYGDQIEFNGHAARPQDLDLFAALGIRALRYPVLWERTAPQSLDAIDWTWAEERLERLQELGVRPIVGLVHHGSGPRHTSLTDPAFAEGLARYAGKVAERFPWVEAWTPVNEPLTTARFSGLYGHWYPHGQDEPTFARALLNQCRATVLAMRAIRQVNPAAQLIQTEDLGKIYSTPALAYQADFENERRWITWDLLCGRVDYGHRLWGHLQSAGIAEHELRWFLDNPCPPDILGINHYLTSERFLDERREHYPPDCTGDNGRDRYADVEAVRVLADGTPGVTGLCQEAWQRYGRPLAITEAHLGCTREEQMRWLLEVWNSAHTLRHEGADIRAVTAWALLGSYDWNSLLTRFERRYEPGVFDARSGTPRPTALAGMLQEMASGRKPSHPVLATAGWWRQPKRLLYCREPGTQPQTAQSLPVRPPFRSEPARPILITGAESALGYAFARLCDHRNLAHIALTREQFDPADPASVEPMLAKHRPWAIINAAEAAKDEAAETNSEHCFRENTAAPALLAATCARQGIAFLTFSSDQVFNGRQTTPYLESDSPTPMSVYGRSKARAEMLVQEIMPSALLVRTGALFGPWDETNFITSALGELSAGRTFTALEDVTVSPTYIPDLVHACLDLLIDGERGLWHLTNQGAVTWKQWATLAAECAGVNEAGIQGCALRSLGPIARRPRYSVLASERGPLLQTLEGAFLCYLYDCGICWAEMQRPLEHQLAKAHPQSVSLTV